MNDPKRLIWSPLERKFLYEILSLRMDFNEQILFLQINKRCSIIISFEITVSRSFMHKELRFSGFMRKWWHCSDCVQWSTVSIRHCTSKFEFKFKWISNQKPMNTDWLFLFFPQDSPYIHFLEEDSHTLFNLPVPTKSEEKFENVQKAAYYLGVVTDKQYCLVKREGTRYRVPVGTRFYRIKVRPLVPNSRTSSMSESEQGNVPSTPSGRKTSTSDSATNASNPQDVSSSASKASTESEFFFQFRMLDLIPK